jgi:hypothetical protein
VAFERGAGQTCPASCSSPSPSEYADAVRAFRARWPSVHEFTPWNEPNHPAQPTAHDPAVAAGYHDQLRILCPSCTVVAGDFVDSANMKSYFRSYAAALRTPAQVWGIHNYGDVTYDRPAYVRWLADQVATPIWMTETGGIVRLGSGAAETLPEDPERAAASIDRVFALAAELPDRVTRAYFYQWRARPGDDFDAGLLAPDDTPRSGLARLRAHLGLPGSTTTATDAPRGPTSPERSSGDGSVAPPTTARTTVTAAAFTTQYGAAPPLAVGRPARTRGGVRLQVACPPARRTGCRGSVTVLLQMLFVRAPQSLGRTTVRLRAGEQRVLSITVPLAARRRWNRAKAWELRTVSVIREPTGVQDRIWRTRRS